jgi:hypothetical protein
MEARERKEQRQGMTKGILYYTDGQLDEKIAKPVRDQIKKAGLPITAVSLKPISFGDTNIHFQGERGALTMAKQILAGLEAMKDDVIFFCEHDVFYNPSHFERVPSSKDIYTYNIHVFKIHMGKMYGLKVDDCRQLSGMCAYRETLLNHYRKKVKMLESGISATKIGYEPGTHNRPERVDDLKSETWSSYEPILDFRTGKNLTRTKWRKEDFRNQKYTTGWTETEVVPSIGNVRDFLTKTGLV